MRGSNIEEQLDRLLSKDKENMEMNWVAMFFITDGIALRMRSRKRMNSSHLIVFMLIRMLIGRSNSCFEKKGFPVSHLAILLGK